MWPFNIPLISCTISSFSNRRLRRSCKIGKSRGTSDTAFRCLTFGPHGHNSRGRSRTCIPRIPSEVTVVFTTGLVSVVSLRASVSKDSPGKVREEFEAVLSRNLVSRGYAPIPRVRSLGRVFVPARIFAEVTLLFHHRRETNRQSSVVRRQRRTPRPLRHERNRATRNLVREHAVADAFIAGGFEPPHPEGLTEVSATFTTDPVKFMLGV